MKSKYRSSYKRRSVKEPSRIIVVVLCAVIFCGVIGASFFLIINMKSKDDQKPEDNLLKIYVAKEDIEHGTKITADKLEEIQINPDLEIAYYSTGSCIEQIAGVDILKGMPIFNNMICSSEMEEGQREVECEVVSLSDNLVDNDYVDVRIMMPNGEDYIVLAKKSVHDLMRSEDDQEERCYLWMSEDEILFYSAAIVDAYLYPGSSLYTTRYIEPVIQEASITTYVPSIGTITMMKQNPNLLQEAIGHLKENNRKQLENRLTNYLNKDIREDLWSETDTLPEDTTINPASQEDTGAISVKESEEQTEESNRKDEKIEEDTTSASTESEEKGTMENMKDKQDALSVFVDDSKIKEASGE